MGFAQLIKLSKLQYGQLQYPNQIQTVWQYSITVNYCSAAETTDSVLHM